MGNDAAALQLFFDTAVVQDADLIVRLAAFNKMVEFVDKETVAGLRPRQLITESANADDMWLSQSLRNAGAGEVKKGPATFGNELIVNGSFENVVGDMPVRWTERAYRGTAQHRVANISHTGKRSIEISAEKEAEYGVYFKVPGGKALRIRTQRLDKDGECGRWRAWRNALH